MASSVNNKMISALKIRFGCVLVYLKVSSSPSSRQLLSILQALLLLGPERADIWQALEAITNRAILLNQDCESSRS